MNAQNTSLVPVIDLVPGKVLASAISKLERSLEKLDTHTADLFAAAYHHAAPASLGGHGDARYLSDMLNALMKAKSVRGQQAKRWLTEIAPFKVTELEDGKLVVSYVKGSKPEQFPLVQFVRANPFWATKEVPTKPTWTIDAQLDTLVAQTQRALKHIEDNKADGVLGFDLNRFLKLSDELKEMRKTVASNRAEAEKKAKMADEYLL